MSLSEFKDWVKNGDLKNSVTDDIPTLTDRVDDIPRLEPEDDAPVEKVYTPSGQEVDVRYAVVDMDSLVTSNTDDGKINPAFPSALQPRDRTRKASQVQISEIAGNLIPDRLLTSSETDKGAPVVSPTGVVESGNGRTLAIRRAYQNEQAANYRAAVEKFAADRGIEIENIPNPVLVRRRANEMTEDEILELTRDSNQSAGLKLSPMEQAKVDADRLTAEDLQLFAPDDNGNVLSGSNSRFVDQFMSAMGQNESSGLRTAEGIPNKEAADRIRSAVFYKAYQSDDLLSLIAEEADPDIKNIRS
jgi:hypothetical protein